MLFKIALLLPVLPLFGWGPFVHPYINRLALKKAREYADTGDEEINRAMLERIEENREEFIFGGNSADAVTTHHVLNNISIYDYAHNALPNDDYKSIPEFGYTLVDEWLQNKENYTGRDFAVACGWLAHQLADWYPHYAAVDKNGALVNGGWHSADEVNIFPGFADSHRVFGAGYYPEILQSYKKADHALIELFCDLLVLNKNREFFYHNRVEMFETGSNTINLLTITSERYRGEAVRIPPEHIPVLKETFNTVIKGLHIFLEVLRFTRPGIVETIANSIDSTCVSGRNSYLHLSVDKVVSGLFKQSDANISDLAKGGPSYKQVGERVV